MRRLQEGSDADGATVARLKWTGFSPLDDMLEGKHDVPNREAAPNGVAVAKAFAQEPSSTNARSRIRTPLPAFTAIVAVPPPHRSPFRGASTRRLHTAAAQLRRPSPPPSGPRIAGPGSAARVPVPHDEAATDHLHRPRHPPMSQPTSSPESSSLVLVN